MARAHRLGDPAPPRTGPGSVDTDYRDELVRRFDLDPDKKVRAYSKGNRQKLVLIAALMTRPDLLVMDEPTNGLDPLMEQAFRLSVHEAQERGQTVFLSSHILSEVEALCDRVGILPRRPAGRDGHLTEHPPSLRPHRRGDLRRGRARPVGGARSHSVVADGQRGALPGAGPVEPLLRVLADTGVTGLLSREPSLEELFLSRYGDRRRAGRVGARDRSDRGRDLPADGPPGPRGPGETPGDVPAGRGASGGPQPVRGRRRTDRPQGGPLGPDLGAVFGVTVASSAISYSSRYMTAAHAPRAAAAYGANHATSALFGPAHGSRRWPGSRRSRPR